MEFIITVVLLIIAYQVSVNTDNRRQRKRLQEQIKKLKDQVYEANQHYQMILLYGKAKNNNEEAFQEEERLIEGNEEGQRSGQTTDKTIDE